MLETSYTAKNKLVVTDRTKLLREISSRAESYYVYVLCRPPYAEEMRPFYVGIGQGDRMFAHEEEAKSPAASGAKITEIRRIWDEGLEVVRLVDCFSAREPWRREEELINSFGLLKDATGILTNAQRYSPSHLHDGVELRKYADEGNDLPSNFIQRDTYLEIGECSPKSGTSVYGKIYAVLEEHPGVTGAELVEILLEIDFAGNKSAYTETGTVSRPSLAKYIDGGFYKKNRYIQVYEES